MSDELAPNYNELLQGDLRIPLEGSEDDAVASVREQLDVGGAVPGDAEIRQLVRDARAGFGAGVGGEGGGAAASELGSARSADARAAEPGDAASAEPGDAASAEPDGGTQPA